MEKWLVFYHKEKELCAYTVRGSFPGERAATIEQLAHEYNIPQEEIRTEYKER